MFAFPRPAAKEPDPPGVTVPESLVKAAKAASWIAFAALVYFLFLYTLDIAKDHTAPLLINDVGMFEGLNLQFHFPYVIGFAIVAVGIPYVAKNAISIFMQLQWRGQFYAKLWALLIAIAVSLVIIAGTFSVQGKAIMEKGRDSAVAVEKIGQDRAAIQARIDSVQRDIDDLQGKDQPRPTMQMMAAREGVIGWQARIDTARAQDAPNREAIERAMSAAKAADALKEKRADLQAELAAAPTVASVSERVETKGTTWIGATMDWLDGTRAMLLALVMDIVCLLMPWIALKLEQLRNAQLAAAGPQVATVADDEPRPFAIEDMRNVEPVKAQPMEWFDENGEPMTMVSAHPRKKGRKKGGKTGKVEDGTEFETAPILSDADPRKVPEFVDAEPWLRLVVADIARRVLYGKPREAEVAPVIDTPEPEQPAPVEEVTPSDAERMIEAGTHEWGDETRTWLRELERNAQQGAADEIVLADGQGVMRTERAD